MIFKQDDWKRTQVRLPPHIHEKLNQYAELNGLSQNAAMLQILEKVLNSDVTLSKLTIVESLNNIEMLLSSKNFQFDDTSIVASRLNECLKMTNEVSHHKLTPSKVAELLNEDSALHMGKYFDGLDQPNFIELDKLSKFFGVNNEWLKHGNLPKFNVKYERLSTIPAEAVKQLLNISIDKTKQHNIDNLIRPTDIYLVRKNSNAGEFLIVKKYNDWSAEVIKTPIHVSDVIGSGGTNMLKSLFVTLEFLYEIYINSRLENCVFVRGFIVEPSDFSDLLEGIIHPLFILKHATNSTWWEDIWDSKMSNKQEYWKGFKSISNQIQSSINDDKNLSETRLRIKKHDFDILKN